MSGNFARNLPLCVVLSNFSAKRLQKVMMLYEGWSTLQLLAMARFVLIQEFKVRSKYTWTSPSPKRQISVNNFNLVYTSWARCIWCMKTEVTFNHIFESRQASTHKITLTGRVWQGAFAWAWLDTSWGVRLNTGLLSRSHETVFKINPKAVTLLKNISANSR